MKKPNYFQLFIDNRAQFELLSDSQAGALMKALFSYADDGMEPDFKGDQALHYVRGRMSVGDGSNTARMRRQRTYIAAFEAKVRQEMKGNGAIIGNLYN